MVLKHNNIINSLQLFHTDEHRKDTFIVAMLLEYYSNNAEKNTGKCIFQI